MARQYFDDGSYIDTLDDGTTIGYNTMGVAVNKVEADGDYFQSPGYWTDARESQKLDAYTPRIAGDTRQWWERAAEYGLTRAIDANFGPSAVNKTSAPASYAGANGRTYLSGSGDPAQQQGGSMVPVLIAAAVALFALA
jgi:hypothetical protein